MKKFFFRHVLKLDLRNVWKFNKKHDNYIFPKTLNGSRVKSNYFAKNSINIGFFVFYIVLVFLIIVLEIFFKDNALILESKLSSSYVFFAGEIAIFGIAITSLTLSMSRSKSYIFDIEQPHILLRDNIFGITVGESIYYGIGFILISFFSIYFEQIAMSLITFLIVFFCSAVIIFKVYDNLKATSYEMFAKMFIINKKKREKGNSNVLDDIIYIKNDSTRSSRLSEYLHFKNMNSWEVQFSSLMNIVNKIEAKITQNQDFNNEINALILIFSKLTKFKKKRFHMLYELYEIETDLKRLIGTLLEKNETLLVLELVEVIVKYSIAFIKKTSFRSLIGWNYKRTNKLLKKISCNEIDIIRKHVSNEYGIKQIYFINYILFRKIIYNALNNVCQFDVQIKELRTRIERSGPNWHEFMLEDIEKLITSYYDEIDKMDYNALDDFMKSIGLYDTFLTAFYSETLLQK